MYSWLLTLCCYGRHNIKHGSCTTSAPWEFSSCLQENRMLNYRINLFLIYAEIICRTTALSKQLCNEKRETGPTGRFVPLRLGSLLDGSKEPRPSFKLFRKHEDDPNRFIDPAGQPKQNLNRRGSTKFILERLDESLTWFCISFLWKEQTRTAKERQFCLL